MSMYNQQRQHKSILTVFTSSDERILLKMQPAELNNRSHWIADFRYFFSNGWKFGNRL